MNNQKGVVHLILPLLLLLVLGAGVFILNYFNIIKLPFSTSFLQKGPSVGLKKEYKNPFNKETQYVNPFQSYKNPFTVNR